ncbi:hypothetical protein GCM10027565_44860 [Bordetella tumulicola]
MTLDLVRSFFILRKPELMPTLFSARLLAASLAMAILLTACGSGDDDDSPSTPTDPGTEQPAQPQLRCAP